MLDRIHQFRTMALLTTGLIAVPPGSLDACTIMTLVAGDQVWMGNNEDFIKRGAVWFVPASEGKLGRVNFGFHDEWGKREDFAQGSMNEKGLAFDAAVTPKVSWSEDKEKPSPENLIELIMDRCATVEQAVEMFRKNNCHHLANCQFMFADASGNSVVVGWKENAGLDMQYRSKDYQVVTNTHLYIPTYRCARWTRASRILAADNNPSIDSVRRALSAVHQEGVAFSSYSCIYDLKLQQVHIYNLTNFDEVVTFDLHDELAKGESSHLLKKLFKHSPRLNDVRARPQRTDFETATTLSEQQLRRFVGTYETETNPSQTVRIELAQSGLKVINSGQDDASLFPESESVFRIAPDRGQVSFKFEFTARSFLADAAQTDRRRCQAD